MSNRKIKHRNKADKDNQSIHVSILGLDPILRPDSFVHVGKKRWAGEEFKITIDWGSAEGRMLNLFFKKVKSQDQANHPATSALLQEFMNRMDLRFNEISAQIREVELSVKELEVKLLTKDLKDKQQMGALHYKLHERKNPKNDTAIEGVELELSLKKRLAREQ